MEHEALLLIIEAMVCKKIRDDQGCWTQLEAYIMEHSEAEFSHGICRECAEVYYPRYCPAEK